MKEGGREREGGREGVREVCVREAHLILLY